MVNTRTRIVTHVSYASFWPKRLFILSICGGTLECQELPWIWPCVPLLIHISCSSRDHRSRDRWSVELQLIYIKRRSFKGLSGEMHVLSWEFQIYKPSEFRYVREESPLSVVKMFMNRHGPFSRLPWGCASCNDIMLAILGARGNKSHDLELSLCNLSVQTKWSSKIHQRWCFRPSWWRHCNFVQVWISPHYNLLGLDPWKARQKIWHEKFSFWNQLVLKRKGKQTVR